MSTILLRRLLQELMSHLFPPSSRLRLRWSFPCYQPSPSPCHFPLPNFSPPPLPLYPSSAHRPASLPHSFNLPALRAHFIKSPTPESAIALIDLEPGVLLDTEEEINVIAASLYVLCVRYDELGEKERVRGREELRKWILKNRSDVINKLAGKVEPPFTAWSMDQMQRDVGAMMEELLLKTLTKQGEKREGERK